MRGRKSGIHNAISLHRLQEQWSISSDTHTNNTTKPATLNKENQFNDEKHTWTIHQIY